VFCTHLRPISHVTHGNWHLRSQIIWTNLLHPAAEGTTLLRNASYLFTQRHDATSLKIRNLQVISEILAVKIPYSGCQRYNLKHLKQVTSRGPWPGLVQRDFCLPRHRSCPCGLHQASLTVQKEYGLGPVLKLPDRRKPQHSARHLTHHQTPNGRPWETTRASMVGSRRELLQVAANHRSTDTTHSCALLVSLLVDNARSVSG
jgi:hypothetical protein